MEKYNNTLFYDSYRQWFDSDFTDKEAQKTMGLEIYNACLSTLKKMSKKCPGIYDIDDLEEFSREALARILQAIKNHYLKDGDTFFEIQSLSNYVYWFCYGTIFGNKKTDRLEVSLSYEDSANEYYNQVYDTFEDDIIDKLSREGY